MTTNPLIANDGKCRFCGMYHGPLCPSVKAIEYHPDGSVKRVEFKSATDWAPATLPTLPVATTVSYSTGATYGPEH